MVKFFTSPHHSKKINQSINQSICIETRAISESIVMILSNLKMNTINYLIYLITRKTNQSRDCRDTCLGPTSFVLSGWQRSFCNQRPSKQEVIDCSRAGMQYMLGEVTETGSLESEIHN